MCILILDMKMLLTAFCPPHPQQTQGLQVFHFSAVQSGKISRDAGRGCSLVNGEGVVNM